MTVISLGPFHFALWHLTLILGVIVAMTTGAIVGRRRPHSVAGAIADLILAAFVAARLGFVIRYFDSYWNDLLGIIDIRDGGFSLWAGLAGAGLLLAYKVWRYAGLRRPLGIALLAGGLAWLPSTALVQLLDQESRQIPDVTLTNLSQQPVALRELEGPLVINLWASWCPPCVREMPVLQSAQDRYPAITFVFANQGEHPDTIRRFLAEQDLELRGVLSDPGTDIGQAIANRTLPTTLFYDNDGTLVSMHRGELSRASLRHNLSRFDEEHLEATPD